MNSCESKSQPGLCKKWGDCPVIKSLIERGEYKPNEVVPCGFDAHEEVICCPQIDIESKIDPNMNTNGFVDFFELLPSVVICNWFTGEWEMYYNKPINTSYL